MIIRAKVDDLTEEQIEILKECHEQATEILDVLIAQRVRNIETQSVPDCVQVGAAAANFKDKFESSDDRLAQGAWMFVLAVDRLAKLQAGTKSFAE